MRTMKRAAAVALSVVMLMTSGVTAKAAVTDAQPAKSGSEAKLKWANKIGKAGWYNADEKIYVENNLSEIALSGNYIYAADDSEHRIMKIDKKTGKIVKSASYKNDSYTIHYGAGIGTGDGKIFVGYGNGIIQAFDENTLQSLWITKSIEKVEDKGQYDQSNAISGKFIYDNGTLYVGTGTYSGKGSYVALTTKDEDPTKDYEIKDFTWQKENDATYYWSKGVSVGDVVVACDAAGNLKSYDKKTGEVKSESKLDDKFNGGIAYDASTNTVYLGVYHIVYEEDNNRKEKTRVASLYGVKIGDDGKFETVKKVEVSDQGYIASTPEVYNGKVYISGSNKGYNNGGFMAVIDVASDQYKVNYTVDLPAYSQSTPVVVKSANDSVKVYFTINTNPNGGIYMIEDSKGATSATAEKIFEPTEEDQKNYCANELHIDSDGTLYYINDSRHLFAVGKKSSDPVKPTQPTTETKPTTTTQTKPTTTTQTKPATKVKPITKKQTSTRSVKLTWKKNKSAKGYVIYAKAGKGKYKKLTTVGKTTKKTVTVKSGTSYKFKVKPYKYTKKKGKKVKKYYKAYAAKAKYGSKTVKVTYKNVKGYTSYRIDMKVGNGSYKKVLTSKKTGTLTLTYTQKKAKVGKSYKFRLVGIKTVNGKSVKKTIK